MSGKKARAARRAAHESAPASGDSPTWRMWLSWKGAALVLTAVGLVAATFALPGLLDGDAVSEAAPGHAGMEMSSQGDGLEPGSGVPAFAEQDVETGERITSDSIASGRTLLFFSEGVMCQACFEQIKGLERMQAELDAQGIRLVSITPDSPGDLRQAMGQYGIESPMIADDDRDMSAAFDTLGLGMHDDTPGHAFVLVEDGAVSWYHDYWLSPDRTMYVEPETVLADLATGR